MIQEELTENSFNNANELLRRESSYRQNDFENETELHNKEDKDLSENIANSIIDSANKYFLVKVLSPEITKNEEKKRQHKDKLIQIIKYFHLCGWIFQLIALVSFDKGIILPFGRMICSQDNTCIIFIITL